MVKLVLFDIDGTLVITGGAGVQAFARTFASEFGSSDGSERLKFAGRTDVSLVREFFSHNRIEASEENFRRFFDRYARVLEAVILECRGRICPGVPEFLRDLKQLPEPPVLGLLTGNVRRGAEIKLTHFGLWHEFSTGAFADDHEDRDCIADIARTRGAALAGRSLAGDEVLVIGDTPLDIRCARAINAKVLAVATGGTAAGELERHKPDWLAPDLAAVSAVEVCR